MAVDIEARGIAIEARSKIESHEDECARRYGEVAAAIADIRGEFSYMRRVVVSALVGVIALLMSVSGFLIVNGQPWAPASHNAISIQENMK